MVSFGGKLIAGNEFDTSDNLLHVRVHMRILSLVFPLKAVLYRKTAQSRAQHQANTDS